MLEHLIVDSGAIIKGCGYEFHKTSKRFWTVQDVVNEIRDSKSLHLLETLPFELEIRSETVDVEDKLKSADMNHLETTTSFAHRNAHYYAMPS